MTNGHLAAVWLDLRSAGTRLYGAFSNDSGATWSKNLLVYESPGGTICQCCHPSLAALGRGEFAVMFRNVQGDSRDMYILKLRDGAVVSTPVKVGNGSWKINACPMDGGGLALSAGRMLTAWRRDGEIFLAKEGAAEMRIGAGKDVTLAAQGDKVFAVWTGGNGIEAWASGQVEPLSKGRRISGSYEPAGWRRAGGLGRRWRDRAAPPQVGAIPKSRLQLKEDLPPVQPVAHAPHHQQHRARLCHRRELPQPLDTGR